MKPKGLITYDGQRKPAFNKLQSDYAEKAKQTVP